MNPATNTSWPGLRCVWVILKKDARQFVRNPLALTVMLAGIIGYGFGFGGSEVFVMPTESIRETSAEERQAELDAEGFGAIRKYLDFHIDLDANELACELYR